MCALKNATFREIVAAQSYTRNVFNVREGRWREVLCANSAACKVYMHIRNYLYICKYANVAFVNMQMHMFVCICTCMNIYVYMQEGWSRYTCTHMHTQMVWHNTNELLKEGYCKTYKHTIAYTCIEVCTLTCLHADGVAQHQRAPQGGLLQNIQTYYCIHMHRCMHTDMFRCRWCGTTPTSSSRRATAGSRRASPLPPGLSAIRV